MSERYPVGGALQAASRHIFLRQVGEEAERAYQKHGTVPWSRHEFYGILLEEVDEVWDAIKKDAPRDAILAEVVQVAAVCLRYAEQLNPKGLERAKR